MSDVEAPPPRSPREQEETEISIAPEPVVAPEKKRRRKKKKTPKPEPKEAELDEFPTEQETLVGMPQVWVDCKQVMAAWLIVTFLIFGLCIITIPVGCVLALFASFLYFSKGGTEDEFGGQYLARTIYFIAFLAWGYDMIIFALTLLAWVILVYGVCEDYDHNICLFRVSAGYFVAAQMCMVFLHATLSFTAYLKVRDCCQDIVLDEKEAKERFVDMEKQIYEEFKNKRREEMAARKKSSKTKKSHT